jgi:hypothetical protein
MKRYVIPITLLAVLPVTAWMLRPVEAAPALKEASPKWEYKAIYRDDLLKEGKKLVETDQEDKLLTAGLNPLGDEGWQIVATEVSSGAQFRGGQRIVYVFRRPK